jgi:GNAT superfamily N-acetyltransferase
VVPTEAAESVFLGIPDMGDTLLLSEEARWNQTSADWAVFMTHGECYGVRAGGRLVASAAILPFGGGFGWISMVLVTADWRRRGLASQLMNRCIDAMRARGGASLLDATPDGALVYGQLGFRSKCGMSRWRGMGRGSSFPTLQAGETFDRATILAGDRRALGGDRQFLIKDFLDRPGTRVIGDARNFVILRSGRRATQIGPLVAQGAAEAQELLETVLADISGPTILDVLDAGACLQPVLKNHGFEAFRSFERMILDREELPGIPSTLMVAAGPEFG